MIGYDLKKNIIEVLLVTFLAVALYIIYLGSHLILGMSFEEWTILWIAIIYFEVHQRKRSDKMKDNSVLTMALTFVIVMLLLILSVEIREDFNQEPEVIIISNQVDAPQTNITYFNITYVLETSSEPEVQMENVTIASVTQVQDGLWEIEAYNDTQTLYFLADYSARIYDLPTEHGAYGTYNITYFEQGRSLWVITLESI